VPIRAVKRSYIVYIWIALALALVSAFALARQADPALVREMRGRGIATTASGLQYKVLKAGQGAVRPTDADVTLVNYQGRLLDGSTFDKSERPTPMPVGQVVPGFAEALKLMNKGARYRFWVPPALAYGAQDKGPIPANSTLVFDVELIDFLPEAALRQMQMQQQMMQGGTAPGMPSGR
jgi:FKBP-type peptidyl-prolyl cis-trans isomerase FkpA